MNMKTEFPCYYDDVKGWIVLSDETIPPQILKGIQAKVYQVNSERVKGMQGDKRKRVEAALVRLRNEGLSVLSSKPGMTLFQATEKTSNKSFHFMGRSLNG